MELRKMTEIDSSNPNCERCAGTGWVCEEHDDKPWGDMTGPWPNACHCGGAGKPCPECNDLSKEPKMAEEPGEDDERSIWLPPEEMARLQREKTRDARDALERRLWSAEFDRLHQRTQSMLAEHDPLSKERRG